MDRIIKNSIFAIDVSTLADPEIFDSCYKAMRPERRERVDRMRFDNGKRLCLGAGVVMEHALRYAGCDGRDVVITPEGKPTVEGCFFNISHTDGVAVCAVSDKEVGIDIERPRKLTDAVINRAFTPREIEMAGDDKDRFILLWTVKESVMKWFGMGLSLMPEYIDILMDDEIKVTILDHPDLNSQAGTLHFSTYRHDDYHITVCSSYENYAGQITWINPA